MDQAWPRSSNEVSLTERELEVLQLKARRRTNAEIGELLFISVTTVKWHVRQIYNKLGVNNRGEAVARARQFGLLARRSGKQEQRHDNLPEPLTSFVGRKQEMQHLTTLLSEPHTRLATITGPGGMGKTRLALQTANRLKDRFANGACWVSFSHLDETEFVFATVEEYVGLTLSASLDLSLQGDEDVWDALGQYLQGKEMLLVLDGFEHLLSSASKVRELLVNSPACRILVSSRERLNVPGETLLVLRGMPYAEDSSADPLDTDSVNLFLQTARRVGDRDCQEPAELAAIQHICARLDGMPLAIELAAEWTRLLSIVEVEQELSHGLEFIGGSNSMRSVIGRSWTLLTDAQRTAFARLSAFQRSFSRDAAWHVTGTNLRTLSALFDKSLIQRDAEDRYTLHDLLREYAAEQLQSSGEREEVRDAHCAYFAKLASNQMEALYRGDHRIMLADVDNLRAAWKWAVKRQRLEDLRIMLFPLDWFYNVRAYYAEGAAAMRFAVDALHSSRPEGVQGIIYGKALASFALEQSRVQGNSSATATIREALAILHRLGAHEDLAWPQLLAIFHGVLIDPHEREQGCLECLAIFEEQGNAYGTAFSLAVLGSVYRDAGRYADAQRCIERGLAVSRSLGDREGEAHALRHLGHLNLHTGQYEAAYGDFQQEYALWQDLGLQRLAGEALRSQGETCLARGDYGQAETILQESLAEFERVGDDGNAAWVLTDLAEGAWREGRLKNAHDYLEDTRKILQRREDNREQARWWQLSGRVALQEGDLASARFSFERALECGMQAQGLTILEIVLDFAALYYGESDPESATLLLGFAQAQTGLPWSLSQWHVDPLRSSLSKELDVQRLAQLIDEGAELDLESITMSLQTKGRS